MRENSTDRDERLSRAVVLRESGHADDARPLLVALAVEYPDDATVQYQAAWVHDALGMEDAAVPYYERALALGLNDPEREGLMLGLGSTYRNVGRTADAVVLLERGVAEYPASTAMRCFLALAQLSDGNAQSAVATLLSTILEGSSSPSVERYRRALTWYRDDLLGVADPDG